MMHLNAGDKPFACNYCNKSFTQKGHLDYHEKTHTMVKPFSCQLCTKEFIRGDVCKAHEKRCKGVLKYLRKKKNVDAIMFDVKEENFDNFETDDIIPSENVSDKDYPDTLTNIKTTENEMNKRTLNEKKRFATVSEKEINEIEK